MKVYQDLTIKLKPEKYDDFIKYLRDAVGNSSWKNRYDMEDSFMQRSAAFGFVVLCFESSKYNLDGEDIAGVLWIHSKDHLLKVSNIVPTIGNNLSFEQYNFILNEFKHQFIDNIAHDYEAEVLLSKDYFDMEDHIGKRALEKLQYFSETSNRSTGRSHPLDFKKWSDFIFAVHTEKRNLSADDLFHWLLEQGWWDNIANELSLDYEYALSLLEEYDKLCR